MANYTFDIKHISAHGSTPLMIRGYQVQIETTQRPLHCDLKQIQRIPILVQNACVRARARARVCVCVCDIYFRSCISYVTPYKRHGMLKEALLFFFFFFFFFVFFFFSFFNIIIISSSRFYYRTRK